MFSKKMVLSVIGVYACAGLIVACAKKESSSTRARSARTEAAGNRSKEAPPEKVGIKPSTVVCKQKDRKARNECKKTKEAEAKEAAEKSAAEEEQNKEGKKVVKEENKASAGTTETTTSTTQSQNSSTVKVLKVPSEDYLRGYLQDVLLAEAQSDVKLSNRELADKITDATLNMNDKTREFTILLKVRDNNKEELITFNSKLKSDDFTAQFEAVKRGDETDAKAKGTLTCMDQAQNGCDVAVAEIRVKKNDSYAKAYVIFRNTRADFNTITPKYESGTEAYKKLKELFVNSSNKITSGNALAQITTNSFEVVKEDTVGASRTRIKMLSYEEQVIAFNGVFGFTNAGESSAEIADRTLNISESMDIFTGSNYLKSINDSIDQIVFRTNNGGGALTFELRMKKLENGSQDILTLAIKRRNIEIKSSSIIIK